MKGKVIVIKQRRPASRRPRCGHAYKRTGSQQFNSGSLLRQVSDATKEAEEANDAMGSEPLLANMVEVTLLAHEAISAFTAPCAFCSFPQFSSFLSLALQEEAARPLEQHKCGAGERLTLLRCIFRWRWSKIGPAGFALRKAPVWSLFISLS